MSTILLWLLIICYSYLVLLMNFESQDATFWFFPNSRSLPKISSHEEEGVHQNPQYTGQHHFHPVPHDHDFCERVVINVSQGRRLEILTNSFCFSFIFLLCNTSTSATFHFPFIYCASHLTRNKQFVKIKCSAYFLHRAGIQNIIK